MQMMSFVDVGALTVQVCNLDCSNVVAHELKKDINKNSLVTYSNRPLNVLALDIVQSLVIYNDLVVLLELSMLHRWDVNW